MSLLLKNQIDEKIADMLAIVCKNPLIFVSETDLHVLFIRELMKIDELNPDHKQGLYNSGCTIGTNNKGKASINKYRTILVHKEYGMGERSRGDVVILSANDIGSIKDPINLKINPKSNQWLIPDYIIEFGTEKATQEVKAFKSHLESDLKKLQKAKSCGYLIHIHRNFIKSSYNTGRGIKNKEKFDSYATAIEQQAKLNLPNVKAIIIIIDIGNESKIVHSKVGVYIPEEKKFVRINFKKLKKIFQQLLH